jgi:hypothetical protein
MCSPAGGYWRRCQSSQPSVAASTPPRATEQLVRSSICVWHATCRGRSPISSRLGRDQRRLRQASTQNKRLSMSGTDLGTASDCGWRRGHGAISYTTHHECIHACWSFVHSSTDDAAIQEELRRTSGNKSAQRAIWSIRSWFDVGAPGWRGGGTSTPWRPRSLAHSVGPGQTVQCRMMGPGAKREAARVRRGPLRVCPACSQACAATRIAHWKQTGAVTRNALYWV